MTAPPSARDLLRAGADRHRTGDLAGAEALYRQALRLDPALADAHNLLGVAARQRGSAAEAVGHVEQALALAPDTPAYLGNLGASLAQAGRLAEAIPPLRAAVTARPEDPTSQRNLGQALAASGDPVAAAGPLRAAIALAPDEAEPRLALAHALRDAGDDAAALEAASEAAALAPAGSTLAEQARFLLAGLGGAEPPLRAPPGYVRALFDLFAPRFDAELKALDYQTPGLLAALLVASGVAQDRSRDVLDLGCGTGMSGAALAPFARRLAGVDLSPRMLEAARARGVYAALHEADFVDWLPRQDGRFGLIAAADVLNYLGDLGPAIAAIAGALAEDGVLAVSIERAAEGVPVALAPTLRFRHDPAYVTAIAETNGLLLRAIREATLRQERGRPVEGALLVFGRAGAPA